jgi:hypothetical protein
MSRHSTAQRSTARLQNHDLDSIHAPWPALCTFHNSTASGWGLVLQHYMRQGGWIPAGAFKVDKVMMATIT